MRQLACQLAAMSPGFGLGSDSAPNFKYKLIELAASHPGSARVFLTILHNAYKFQWILKQQKTEQELHAHSTYHCGNDVDDRPNSNR